MNRIKELRTSMSLNQSELAKILGISQGTLSYWENGVYEPDNKSLVTLAEYFNVTTDYLLGKSDVKTPPAHSAEGEVDLGGLNYAFYDAYSELDEGRKKQLHDMADWLREQQRKQEGKSAT